MSLAGRVALVTGGGRGVGRGIAMSLAEAGATVAVNYRRDEEAAAATVAEIISNGGKAQAYAASVDDYDQDAEMVAAIEADHGAIGILVNNAGIASRGRSVVDTDPAEMRRVVATRLWAALSGQFSVAENAPTGSWRHHHDFQVATRSLGGNGAPYNMGQPIPGQRRTRTWCAGKHCRPGFGGYRHGSASYSCGTGG